MTVKILTQEEYDHLKDVAYETLVSELDMIINENQLVVVEQPDETYKVIAYRFYPAREHLGLIVTKDQLQKFILLTGI